MSHDTASLPLTGVRVLDLSRLLPGPYATRQLAELGAEVVKVEDPRGGDYARWYPPLTGEPPVSGIFRELNRGKKSVALDLKQPAAKEALGHLVARADVLVDSFRPGVLTRLELDPKALTEQHPRLVYCAVTGFGLTGPDAGRPGHDIGYLARAGGLALGDAPDRPALPAVQVADIGGALSAVAGILAALFERERTGRGRVVDISLLESAMAFGSAYLGKLNGGEVPRRGEEMLDGSRPCYGVYRTKDGRFLAVGSLEPKFWKAFLEVVELPELELSPMDGGEPGRAAKEKIQARLEERTRDEWMARFDEVEACVEPVLDLDELHRDPHLTARHAFHDGGAARTPVRVQGWEAVGRAPAPLDPVPNLGEHTDAVLRDAGVPEDLIRALT